MVKISKIYKNYQGHIIRINVPVEEEPQLEELTAETTGDESEGDQDWAGPSKKKRKVFPFTAETLTILDRTMVNDTAAAALLTASIVDLGIECEQLSTSTSSIRRKREIVSFSDC